MLKKICFLCEDQSGRPRQAARQSAARARQRAHGGRLLLHWRVLSGARRAEWPAQRLPPEEGEGRGAERRPPLPPARARARNHGHGRLPGVQHHGHGVPGRPGYCLGHQYAGLCEQYRENVPQAR